MVGCYCTTYVTVLLSVFLTFNSSVWTDGRCSGVNEFCVPSADCQYGQDFGGENKCEIEGEVCCEQPTFTTGAYLEGGAENSVATVSHADAPISGFLAGSKEFPWSVTIFQSSLIGDVERQIRVGGGTVYEEGIILTSVECVRHRPKASLRVHFHRWHLNDSTEIVEEVLKVETIVPHPGYKPSSKQNNIALMFVEDKVRDAASIIPMCSTELEQRNDTKQNCYIVGWNSTQSDKLKLPVDSPNRAECQESIRRLTRLPKFVLSPNDVCAFSKGAMDENYPCARITGSALVCDIADHFCLVGISSYSLRKCSRVSVHDVFVDVRQYTEWIEENVRKHRPQLK